ncbi:MAG: hypothetical protein J7L04_11050 [Bacteroidales bacterium]|nr:hypothetical protein [Bacteroidales bacterium]
MMQDKFIIFSLLVFTFTNTLLGSPLNPQDSCTIFTVIPLNDLAISTSTGEKPQSKVWYYDGSWWTVLSTVEGTRLLQLKESMWKSVLFLSDSTNIKADARAIGNVVHILLFHGWESELVSIEYNSKNKSYQLWSNRPDRVKIRLEPASEIATIDIDASGRMWLASDDHSEINIRWSDPPYELWSKPQALVTGISRDDISVITAFPDGSMAVLWSNQNTKRYGFRIHMPDTSPDSWLPDEVPASASAIPWKNGMADDHLNLAVASDGTLYAAVKTSYDTDGYPLIALLVRRPSGEWDELYTVDDEGSRGIVLLNEEEDCLMVVYTSYRDHKIVCKRTGTKQILFGERSSLMDGIHEENTINNVTSTKQNINNELVIIASDSGIARSVLMRCLNK